MLVVCVHTFVTVGKHELISVHVGHVCAHLCESWSRICMSACVCAFVCLDAHLHVRPTCVCCMHIFMSNQHVWVVLCMHIFMSDQHVCVCVCMCVVHAHLHVRQICVFVFACDVVRVCVCAFVCLVCVSRNNKGTQSSRSHNGLPHDEESFHMARSLSQTLIKPIMCTSHVLACQTV